MKLKEQAIKALDSLNASEISIIYDLICLVKDARGASSRAHSSSYLKTREALASCPGSFADEIIHEREDRI